MGDIKRLTKEERKKIDQNYKKFMGKYLRTRKKNKKYSSPFNQLPF